MARTAAPARTGSLTLIFESGKPCAAPSFTLGDVDALTLGRARGSRSLQVSTEAGERRLGVPDRRMSVVHAHLRRMPEGWSLEDARSKNSTRVNGVEISRTVLRSGDLIELGRSFLVFLDNVPYAARRESPAALPGLTTQTPAFARQLEDLAAIARSSIPIVVRGETGTGKELIARAVHQGSGRSGPMRAVNCGALSRSLLVSELFGHRKGAFSGADEDRPGLIRSADRGTLFLDEIGDLPLDGQVALLRVLQEGEVLPVGGLKPVPVDVRVIAATHRDLHEMVSCDTFRADLLARLTGFTVVLPPLRERREDLGALVRTLVARAAPLPLDRGMPRTAAIEFCPAAIRALYAYAWPGNVRELDKVIATALVLADGRPIEEEHLAEAVRAAPHRTSVPLPGVPVLHEGARDRLDRLLALHKGNVNAVAREMRTSRTQVQRLCHRFGIDLRVHRLGAESTSRRRSNGG